METKLFKHNEEAYKKVLKVLEDKGRAAVVHPTGTGKMFIAAQWLIDNPSDSFLFMAPTYEIIDQFKNTLAYFGKTEDDFPFLQTAVYEQGKKEVLKHTHFDKIVLDEFHRSGAPVWEKTVNSILEYNKTALLLGLSATPVRVLDNQKDMAEILFKDAVASTMTLEEAMAEKILPCPVYITADLACNEEIESLAQKVDKQPDSDEKLSLKAKIEIMKEAAAKIRAVPELFKDYFPENGKFIVFCEDEKDIAVKKEFFVNLLTEAGFAEPKIYSVSYSKTRKENKEEIASFEKDDDKRPKLMFSINLLNEGVHIDDVDGVIMLRHTISPILYRQQLGRGLTCGNGKSPIIFDIVNNYEAGKSGVTFRKSFMNTLSELGKSENMVENFKMVDEQQMLRELMEEVDISTRYTWKDWMGEARKFKEENGNLAIPYFYVSENGMRLGIWMSMQRSAIKFNLLPEGKKKELDDCGMIYDMRKFKFYEGFNKIKELMKRNGWTINDIASDYVDFETGFKAGEWLTKKRVSYLKKKMPEYQIKEFEKEKFVWEVYKEEFYKNLKIIDDYCAENNITINDVSCELVIGSHKIGAWLRRKKEYIRNGKSEEYQVEELVNKRHLITDQLTDKFFKNLDKVQRVAQGLGVKINDIPYSFICEDGSRPYIWVKGREHVCREKKLPPYQFKALKTTNFDFGVDNPTENYTDKRTVKVMETSL